MFLSDGSIYRPGEGAARAITLRRGDLDPEALARNIAEARDSIRLYGHVPGATDDLFVADLILRGLINYREVAFALLDPPSTVAEAYDRGR